MSEVGENDRRNESPSNYLETSSQNTKINKRNLANQPSPIPPKRPKLRTIPENEVIENVSDKKDHKLLLKQKKQIQNLIDYKSPRIILQEIPTTKFSKNNKTSTNFQLITLDGEPITELMLCKKCKQVRARGHMTSTTIVRHLKQHEQVEMAHKIAPKKKTPKNQNALQYAACLTQAIQTSCPIPVDAQKYAAKLHRYDRQGIEKMIRRQGDPESQKTFCRNLNMVVSNRMSSEKSEQKRKQLLEEFRANERVYSPEKYPSEESSNLDKFLVSKPSSKEKETPQSKVSKVPAIAISNGDKPTSCSTIPTQIPPGNETPGERAEEAGIEILSLEHPANEESRLIEENEINLEIPNDDDI